MYLIISSFVRGDILKCKYINRFFSLLLSAYAFVEVTRRLRVSLSKKRRKISSSTTLSEEKWGPGSQKGKNSHHALENHGQPL